MKVQEEFKPVVIEKMKEERIKNIVAPNSVWGRSSAHADPSLFINNAVNGALPKSGLL